MKTIDILENLDDFSEVTIWNFEEAEMDDWEKPTYDGSLMDVPYYLTKTVLLTPKECLANDIEGPMRTALEEKNGIFHSRLVIFVKEEN